MMKSVLLFVLLMTIGLVGEVSAQELTVKQMTALPVDLSASHYERKDLNGKGCALVKVQLASTGAQFEGNVIGTTEYKTNEYWVYMTDGSYMLSIKHPSFVPLSVNFRDHGINSLQSKTTYRLTLLMPQTGGVVETQKLIINYLPKNATVLIDSKLYNGEGRVEAMLPVGNHSYIIASDGYETAEGSVKLNASAPRTITENLIVAAPVQQQQVQRPIQHEPVQQQPVQQPEQISVVDTPSTPSASTGASIETITVKGVSFNMIRVDGGTFQMGATSEQQNPDSDEKPVHQVTLSTYYIGETEVTQALWEAVMGSNPSSFKGDNKPVEKVSWNDCQEFIQKLNQITERSFRLPTEAEWEYAARGGRKSRGYQYSGSNNLENVAWYDENSRFMTHVVKTKQANELGLYDMSGNVWEWCQDWKEVYFSSSQTNPMGPTIGSDRVYRGGSWDYSGSDCRVARRLNYTPEFRFNYLGLRLALQ